MLGLGSWLYFPKTIVPDERLPAAAEDWFSDGALPSEWMLSRSAAALGRGSDGRWASYAADTIRDFHDPTTLERLGFLIETQARAQLIYRSRSSAGVVGVVANNATITTDAAVQTPFGVGGTKIVPTTAVAQHGFNLSFNSALAAVVSDNTTVAFQIYLKPTGTFYTKGEIFLLNRAGIYSSVAFALDGAGTVTETTGSVLAAIEPDTDGFYRLTMVMQYGAGTTNPTCNLLLLPAAGTRSHAGDGTSGFWMAYLGAEVGAEPTSPILSDGTVMVTRPAESLTSATNWFQPGPRSFGIQYTPLSLSASQTVMHGTASDLLEIRNVGETVTYNASVGGVSSAVITGAAPAPGIERTVVVVAARDQFRLVQDGTILGTDATGESPADLPVLRIGSAFGGLDGGAMLLKRFKYWNIALSPVEAPPYSSDLSKAGQVVTVPVLDIQPSRTVLPSETTITLTVTLTGEATGPTVNWSTTDDTAKVGIDYIGGSGVLGFSPGTNAAEITIDLATRSTEEERTFSVDLLGAAGATIGNARCVVTLQRVVQQGPAATIQSVFGATLPAEWTLTRATAARTRGSDGIWVAVSANAHRHHYVAPGVSGILIQAATSEQRIYDSVDPGWTLVGSTKTIDTTTQTMVGTRSLNWRKDTSTGDHRLSVTLTSANADMPTGEFTFAATVKPVGGMQYWGLRIKGIDNVIKQAVFDLSGSGSVVSQDTDIILIIEADPFYAGYYTVTMNRSQAVSAGVDATIELWPADSFGNVSLTGDTSHGLDIAHLQLEPFAYVGAPVVPAAGTSAKIVRVGDVLKATGTWYQRQSYTIGIRYIRLRDAPTTQRLLQLKEGTTVTTVDDNGLTIEGGTLTARLRTGSTNLAPIVGGTTTRGTIHTALMVVDAAGRIALFEGGVKRGEIPVGASGGAAPLVPAVLRIGSTEPSATAAANFLIQAVYLWNDPLSDADAALFSGNLAYSPPPGPAQPPVLSIPSALSVQEGATLSVPITKTGTGACSVTFRTKAGTASLTTDYVGVLQTVSFGADDTSISVDIATVSDAVADPNENFQIILEAPTDATLGNAVCVATITELPRITMPTTFSVNEGSTANITLSKVGTGVCSVVVQTQQVTATVGTDYTGVGPLTVNFTADQTSAVVSIQTATDAAAESTETFNLNMTSPTGCTIGTPQCVISIIDANSEPPPADDLFAAPRGFATGASFGIAASGGSYYRVTNLADSGAGSLFGAFGLSNRVVIFEVAGVIKWTSDKRITGSNLTFAGETAPSPGITIQGTQNPLGGRMMMTGSPKNIKWSHVVWERGYADPEGTSTANYNTNADSLTVAPNTGTTQTDVWFDHCAFFWSNDENVQLYHGGPVAGITRTHENTGLFRWDFTSCMFCEPLYSPESLGYLGHWENRSTGSIPEYKHNYNFLVGPYCKNISIQYCMFAEHGMRGPFIDYAAAIVLANNLAINCSMGASIEMNDNPSTPAHKITCVGYLMISGPNAPTPHAGFRFTTYPNPLPGTGNRYYIHDLYAMKGARAEDGLAPTSVTWDTGTKHFGKQVAQPGVLLARTATKPIDIPGGSTAMSANDIFERAKANVGPRPKENNGNRVHPAVARSIQKLRDRTGKWVNHESVAGGGTGKTSFAQVNRPLNGATKFPDGTTIPAPPTYSNAAEVKAWLKLFTDRLQYD